MLDMCCLVLAGSREQLSWRLDMVHAGMTQPDEFWVQGTLCNWGVFALGEVFVERRVDRVGLADGSGVSSSGMAKGIVILNKVPVLLLSSR